MCHSFYLLQKTSKSSLTYYLDNLYTKADTLHYDTAPLNVSILFSGPYQHKNKDTNTTIDDQWLDIDGQTRQLLSDGVVLTFCTLFGVETCETRVTLFQFSCRSDLAYTVQFTLVSLSYPFSKPTWFSQQYFPVFLFEARFDVSTSVSYLKPFAYPCGLINELKGFRFEPFKVL